MMAKAKPPPRKQSNMLRDIIRLALIQRVMAHDVAYKGGAIDRVIDGYFEQVGAAASESNPIDLLVSLMRAEEIPAHV